MWPEVVKWHCLCLVWNCTLQYFQSFQKWAVFCLPPWLPLDVTAINQGYAWVEPVTDALPACDWCVWALSFLLTDPFTKSLIGDKFTCEFIIPSVVPEGFLNKQATKRILYSWIFYSSSSSFSFQIYWVDYFKDMSLTVIPIFICA